MRESASAKSLAPGTRVGRYVVLKPLGRGGVEVVYLAYDEELDRRVALKLLTRSADLEPPESGDRLLREVQAMAKLSHPNVAPIYDFGTAGTEGAASQVFLAMEYIDGVSLRAWREASPRSVKAIVEMYAQAGRGLAAAHAGGVLHRDFKAESVRVDAAGTAHVVDFGTAGTAESAAPEQLRREPADPRSDVFAFAVALWEAIYGERPYEGTTGQELLAAIDSERIRTTPKGGPRSRAVRTVLLRGLRAKPDDRWPTMRAMVDALARAVESRTGYAVAGVIAVAVVAGVALAGGLRRRAPPCAGADGEIASVWSDAQRMAVKAAFVGTMSPRAEVAFTRVAATLDGYAGAWTKMRVESCEATRVRHAQSGEALDLRTACLDQRRAELKATADVLARADAKLVDDAVNAARGLSDIGECADVDALRSPYTMPHDPEKRRATEGVRRKLAEAKALRAAERYEEAWPVIEDTLARARALGSRPTEAAALILADEVGWQLEKSPDPKRVFDAALDADATGDDQTEAEAWIRLVLDVGYEAGRPAEGEEYARLAASAITRGGGSPALTATLASMRGDSLYAQGKIAQAVPFYRDSLATRTRVFGAASPEVALTDEDIGDDLAELGHEREATDLFATAVRTFDETYGKGHPLSWRPTIGLAYAAFRRGDLAAMSAALRQLEGIASTPSRLARSRKVHILRSILAGDDADGVKAFRAEILSRPSGWGVASDHFMMAMGFLRRHGERDALDEFDVTLRILATAEGDLDVKFEARAGRALSLARLGRAKEALPDAERSLADGEALASGKPLDVPYLALGEIALALGDASRAAAMLDLGSSGAENDDASPELHADLHLALARALAASDPVRARTFADRAAGEYDGPNVRLPDLAVAARALARAASGEAH